MLILSASNVKKTKKKSQSLVIAMALKDTLKEYDISAEVIDLRKYELTPCIMCEKCVKSGKCVRGDDYNKLAKKIIKHRNIIIVCPHYAGIPSKIMMLLEKMQEVCYLKACTKQKDAYPLKGAYAAVIAHGGMIENYDALYTANIITPLGNALKAVAYDYINDTTEEPLCIGVKQYFEKRERQSVCFLKENDMKKIRNVVKELAHVFAKSMESGEEAHA